MDHKNSNYTDLSFPDQKIVNIEMDREVKNSFIEYAMSVITSRALPDVRDGMKPGQRRVMWAMYEDHLTSDRPFCKSATTVGNVLGRYHPHGDAAVYGTMVRMAQDFSLRYPLIEGHGNFGSVDGDPPAAYRYTEARMAKIADEMLRDIDKKVVVMDRNFDNRREEPSVLPSRFPNLLVNGAVGIAVGMATNIPPHNLGETVDAVIYRMENPDCTAFDLMSCLKGPDFPTAGIIYGTNGIKQAYLTGKGRIMVRARARIEDEHHRIIITEIPYGVNKSLLCQAIAGLVKDKRIEGITDMRDESGRNGMRIVIEYRRDANGEIILRQLYKYSQLEDTCAVNMLSLVRGEPKILPLTGILDEYIAHQESVITRRTEFELEKALARVHILEGYKIATDNIDDIVDLMKKSPSIPESKAALCERYSLSDVQAQAIVDMTLGRLTGLERDKVLEEMNSLYARIEELRAILADIGRVKEIIKEELTEIKRKYADPRRTEIVEAEDDIQIEDLIEKHDCAITVSHTGYIKRLPADTYTAQRRGGKGIIGMTTKDDDFIEKVLVVYSHSYLMFFTDKGKVYMRKAYNIPEAGRNAKGTNIVNIIGTEPGEKISEILSVDNFDNADERYLTMVTAKGIIKRSKLSEYEYQLQKGKRAISLDEDDEVVRVLLTDGGSDIMIATAGGYANRFREDDARCMGRTSRGVRGIRLREGDRVVGALTVEEGKKLLTLTEKGFGKQTEFSEYRTMANRGSQGFICHNISEKTGRLIGIAAVCDSDDIMVITDSGTVIRTPVADISTYSRYASGVIVMRLGEGQSCAGFTPLVTLEEAERRRAYYEGIEKGEIDPGTSLDDFVLEDGEDSDDSDDGESGDLSGSGDDGGQDDDI